MQDILYILYECYYFIFYFKEENTKLKISNKSLETQNRVCLNEKRSLAHAHKRDVLKISELEKGVLDRDRTILKLRQTEKDQSENISRLKKERNILINDKTIILKQKDEEMSKLLNENRTNAKTISSLKTDQMKQSNINAQMEKELQDKYQDIVNLKKEEKDKNEAIFEKITSELEKAESNLKKKDEIISELAAESNEKDARILRLQSENRVKDAALLKLSNNVTAKQSLLKQLIERKTRSLSTSVIDSCTEGNKGTTVVFKQTENVKDISSVALAGKPPGAARLCQDLVGSERALLADEIRREFDQKILKLKNAQVNYASMIFYVRKKTP